MDTALWIIAICILVLTVRELLTSFFEGWAQQYGRFQTPGFIVGWIFRVALFLTRPVR